MIKFAKIILIVLIIIGIIALVSLAVEDKFSKSSSNSVSGNVVFPITGFAGEGESCACDPNDDTYVEFCSDAYPGDTEYCDTSSGKCVECLTGDDSWCESEYGDGYVCVDNSCVAGCSDSSDCPEPTDDYYCDTWSNGLPGTCELYCGDGECNNGETEETCSEDCTSECNSCSGCSPAPDWCGYCGDGSCNNGETPESCSQDCGTGDPCNGDPCCGDACCLSGWSDPIACGWGTAGCDPSWDPSCPGYAGYDPCAVGDLCGCYGEEYC